MISKSAAKVLLLFHLRNTQCYPLSHKNRTSHLFLLTINYLLFPQADPLITQNAQ